jgi:hypothetical protein
VPLDVIVWSFLGYTGIVLLNLIAKIWCSCPLLPAIHTDSDQLRVAHLVIIRRSSIYKKDNIFSIFMNNA